MPWDEIPAGKDYIEGMPGFIQKVKDLVTFFHHSVNASDELKKIQFANGKTEGTYLKLLQSVETRKSSSYYMLDRFIELADVVGVVLLKFPEKTMLTGADLATIRVVRKILEPFEKVTREMSADSTTTASKVIPMVHLLRQVSN